MSSSLSEGFTPGTLYLFPTPLGRNAENNSLPEAMLRALHSVEHFAVEHVPPAVSFLKWAGHPKPDYELHFYSLDKRTNELKLQEYITLLLNGDDLGVLTDAGCPGVADPGAGLVAQAHHFDIPVHPFTGPSSPILALMGSGLGGQQFSFHGYLPVKPKARTERLLELEQESAETGYTQLFMETPHRNIETYRTALDTLGNATQLSIAANLTLPDAYLRMRLISEWKHQKTPPIDKIPAIFGLRAAQKPKPNLSRKAVKKKFSR
jgi:16S rRNA (cytidine1402-2'-O)-methyltransferase